MQGVLNMGVLTGVPLYKFTPEMRTPLYTGHLTKSPNLSTRDWGFHCTCLGVSKAWELLHVMCLCVQVHATKTCMLGIQL